jgi:hypothetical protein
VALQSDWRTGVGFERPPGQEEAGVAGDGGRAGRGFCRAVLGCGGSAGAPPCRGEIESRLDRVSPWAGEFFGSTGGDWGTKIRVYESETALVAHPAGVCRGHE